MRFYTVDVKGKERVAVESTEGGLIALDSMGIRVCDMNELISRYDELKEVIKQGLAQRRDEQLNPNEYRILAPIPCPKQDVICLGVNYRSHIQETVHIHDFTNRTDAIYFSKRVNRCNDPGGRIPAYDFVDSLDYEVELGVILKRDTFCVSPEKAGESIFGYTIINDVSARNIQRRHQQWYRGKSLDGYTPMGPCIVTADEIGDAHDLNIACFVNGQKRQDSNTSLMITTVEAAISELSQGMTLQAGTIIATGTPGGVAMGMPEPVYLKEGDVVRCVIEKIGELTNAVG